MRINCARTTAGLDGRAGPVGACSQYEEGRRDVLEPEPEVEAEELEVGTVQYS